MPLEPKKVKWRRQHRGRRRGMATRGSHVSFGSFGLKTVEAGWVTARQIESARIAIIRQIRKHGRMWIRIFPDKPITKKPIIPDENEICENPRSRSAKLRAAERTQLPWLEKDRISMGAL
mgnify:CR=1 FL=1